MVANADPRTRVIVSRISFDDAMSASKSQLQRFIHWLDTKFVETGKQIESELRLNDGWEYVIYFDNDAEAVAFKLANL